MELDFIESGNPPLGHNPFSGYRRVVGDVPFVLALTVVVVEHLRAREEEQPATCHDALLLSVCLLKNLSLALPVAGGPGSGASAAGLVVVVAIHPPLLFEMQTLSSRRDCSGHGAAGGKYLDISRPRTLPRSVRSVLVNKDGINISR